MPQVDNNKKDKHEDEHYEVCWIDKIEVARRQIREAVRLFFGARDPVAIHTLIASAHQILGDISDKRGAQSVLKNVKRVNYPFNFLKHADRDPRSTLGRYCDSAATSLWTRS